MRYFSIAELEHSETAIREGITNRASPEVIKRLTALIENLLDPVRTYTGRVIIVTSGYRCPKLNERIGGAAKSQHMKGEAADIIQPGKAAQSLYETIIEMQDKQLIEYDQLILEYNRWVHVSHTESRNRRQAFVQS